MISCSNLKNCFTATIITLLIAAGCKSPMAPSKQKNTIRKKETVKLFREVKWMKDLEGAKIIEKDGCPIISMGKQRMPVLSSYFGYLYDDYGYTQLPKEGHKVHSKNLAKAGALDIVQLPISIYVPGKRIDFERARSMSKGILKDNPDSKFFLRCHIFSTPKFAKKYPDDIARFEDGTQNHWTKKPRINSSQSRISFASQNFREEAALGVVNMLEKLKKENFANQVIGIIITTGWTGEFNWWQAYDRNKHIIDYSPAMQKAFQKLLKEKYHNNQKELAIAWSEPDIEFSKASLPSFNEIGVDIPDSCNGSVYNIPGAYGYFRSPDAPGNMKVIDFYECMNLEVSKTFEYICRAIKEASGRKLLTSGHFGGPLTIVGYHIEGQSAFNYLIDSPWVDIFVTPWTYEGRSPGEYLFFRGATESVSARKKVYWIECDTRTSTAKQPYYGSPKTLELDKEILKRDLARLITTPFYGFWFEMKLGWYTEPEQIETIKQISEIGAEAVYHDRSRESQIAVIFDEKSMFFMSEWLNFILNARMIIQELGYIGTDYDVFNTEDIGSGRLEKYKFIIFTNAASLNNLQREKIQKYLKNNKRTILWLYGAGLINPDLEKGKCATKNMSELTGIKIVAKNGTHSLDMQLLKKMGQVPAKFHFGDVMRPVTSGHGCTPDKPLVLEPLKADPRFAINDPSAKNLASYQGSKETSFAIKDMGDWTSVYIGAPIVPSKILRELAKSSGVHIYLDTDDIVWRNKSFLAIHALTAGPKTIHLPEEMKVMDLFQDNKIISNGKKEFTVNMKKFATKIFYTGKKQWMEEGKKGGKDIQ